MTDRKFHYLDWDQVTQMSHNLAAGIFTRAASKIKSHREIKRIGAVSRGGFIPATIIAHRLKISSGNVFSVHPDSQYEDYGNDLALIDEICDTGKTFRELHERYPNAIRAALCVKPQGLHDCDIFSWFIPEQSDWIVFPWEDRSELPNR